MWRALAFSAALLGSSALADSASQAPPAPQQVAPAYATSGVGTMYASTCPVTVNTATPTSTFCPVATDPNSAARRTYPAGALVPGKTFRAEGGGTYTVPAANQNTADIIIRVGSSAVMSLTTPAAPVGTNQGVQFIAICTVQASGTSINCQGSFTFIVAGALGAPAPFNQTNSFVPGVANLIDVTGDWNTNAGALTTQSTTVTEAVLTALN